MFKTCNNSRIPQWKDGYGCRGRIAAFFKQKSNLTSAPAKKEASTLLEVGARCFKLGCACSLTSDVARQAEANHTSNHSNKNNRTHDLHILTLVFASLWKVLQCKPSHCEPQQSTGNAISAGIFLINDCALFKCSVCLQSYLLHTRTKYSQTHACTVLLHTKIRVRLGRAVWGA